MAGKRLRLSRSQLGAFLQDFESIKQFENLFNVAEKVAPIVSDDSLTESGVALSVANASFGETESLSDRVGILELSPIEEPECQDMGLGFLQIVDKANVHNDLSDIQGGAINEHYHLTSSEYASIGSVSVTAPITGDGTPGSPVAIPLATSLASGYLSNLDWSTFNGKQAALGFTPADDTSVVHDTGDETVAGIKTFSSPMQRSVTAGSPGTDIALKMDDGANATASIDFLNSWAADGGEWVQIRCRTTAGTVFTAFTLTKDGGMTQPVYAYASLPAGSAGMRAFVNNNSASAAFGSAANNSGSTTYPVYHDGVSWKIG